MRPSLLFFAVFFILLVANGCLAVLTSQTDNNYRITVPSQQRLIHSLGLTDLALTTEARYTRHPAVSDPVAPFMDHPGAIEHFPSGSFMIPQPHKPQP